jgi:hypothetical protein
MSIPSTPSSLTVPITRHKGYFIHEADLTIRVHRIYVVSSTCTDRRRMPHLGRKLHVPSPPVLFGKRICVFQAETRQFYTTRPGCTRVFGGESARIR